MARRLLPALTGAWMGALLYLSVRPALPEVGVGGFAVTDSLLHVAGYALLGLLVYGTLASRGRGKGRGLARWAVAAALAFLWGAFNEMLQALVPERAPEWKDLLANGVGAAAGALGAAVAPSLGRVARWCAGASRVR